MARAWLKLMWHSFGVAAVAAAAQLAVAQALGIIGWNVDATTGEAAWKALLTWIAFMYGGAVLAGAAVGRRALRRPGRPEGATARIVAGVFAAVGALTAGALVWLPARDLPTHAYPELLVVTAAGAGVVAGLLVTAFALAIPPVAGNVRATVSWIWVVAIGCAIAGLATHNPYAAPRLGVLDAPSLVPTAWWSVPTPMIGLAAVIGAGVALVARWGDNSRIGIAVSGLAGPALVASAYLLAGRSGAGPAQSEPYLAALVAAGAGLCGSVLVAAVPGRRGSVGAVLGGPIETGDPASAGMLATKGGGSGGAGVLGGSGAAGVLGAGGNGGTGRTAEPATTGHRAVAIPAQPARALVGEIVGDRTAASASAAASVPSPNRFAEEDYANWLRDLGDRQHLAR